MEVQGADGLEAAEEGRAAVLLHPLGQLLRRIDFGSDLSPKLDGNLFQGREQIGIGQTVADHHQVDIAGGGVVALGDRSIVEAPPGIAEENRQDTLLYLGEQRIGQTREGNRPRVTARPARMLLDGLATRYSTRMKVTIDLSPAQAERLRQEAERLGLTPEDLARAAVADLLATRDDDFEAAARRVLQKNQELYRRLA